MGEATKPVAAAPKKPRTIKKAGFRRIMVTVTEEQAKRLDDLAIQDDRESATNMLTCLVKRNFEAIVGTFKPVQPNLRFEEK